MSVVRGTALANYPSLVAGLGGDPATLLRAAGVRDQDVGNYDAFISIRAAIRAIESAAAVTATMDFGRRLAQRQGIEILGPVGVAARTAATVGDALAIFNTFMAATAQLSPSGSRRWPDSGHLLHSSSCSTSRRRIRRPWSWRSGWRSG